MTVDTSTATTTAGTETAATGTETASTETTGTETDAAAETKATETAPAGETAEAKATRLETENAKLRKENASDRTTSRDQAAETARTELIASITKAMGGDTGQAPTVEELTRSLTEQTTKTAASEALARDTQAELVVWQNATDLKVDAGALTDSRAFAAAIKDLDPTNATFVEDVKTAAQEAAEKNPKLKSTQAAGKSGTEISGGSGEGAVTPEQFKEMSGAERNDLARRDPTTYARLSGRS